MENTVGNTLFDLLVTRDFEPELLDSGGKPVTNPAEAELFSFDWKTQNNNYGTVVVLLGRDNELEVYYGDNLGRGMETEDRKEWYTFLEQMKKFASRNLMTFELNNISRLKYTMQGMAAIKEGLFESFYGRRNISYSDGPKQTKLVIKHSRNLGEGEARFRAIESLFVETADGERFRVPSRSLAHGRMLERHIAEGGNPYDAFGQHINEIVSEMSVLSRFLRASKNRNFTGNVDQVVSEAVRHYQALKTKVKRMISQRGYSEERENFDPTATNESTVAVEQLRSMFIEQTLDHRIEEALPVLARLAAVGVDQAAEPRPTPMKELSEFAGWMDSITEQTPTSGGDNKQLGQLMAQEITAGPDGINAIEQLSGTAADDEQLFDRIRELSIENPDTNIWEYPGVRARLQQMGIDIDPVTEPAPEPAADPAAPPETEPEPDIASDIDAAAQDLTKEALDTDGVMMTRPSNMSSESAQPNSSLKRIIELINR
jgi:hypothetical protein